MTDEPSPTSDPPDEQDYRELIRESNLVLRTGNLMLGAGTSSLRVRTAMLRVSRALGIEHMQATISFTNIVVTTHQRTLFRTLVGEVTTPGVNADRIRAIQKFARGLPARADATDVTAQLDRIEARPPVHPAWMVTLAVGLACISVGFLGGGGWRELLAVFVAAMASYSLHRQLLARKLNLFGSVVLSTLTASLVYLAVSWFSHGMVLESTPRMVAGFIAASIFLVPGFPLFTGSLDLARLDLQAGIGRLTYAALVMLSIGIGAWVVASVAGLVPTPPPPVVLDPVWLWTLRVLASFGAVFGWAIMFNSPWPEAVWSGMIAIVGSMVRLLLLEAGTLEHVATFVGALVMGVLCHAVGRWFGLTRLIMLVPVMLVMIPGSPALQALLHFNSGDLFSALGSGIFVVLQVIAMVCGLVASMMVLDPAWAFTRRDSAILKR
ncbi:threonine/serine ThrE exporter family protein [Propionibacteriaceae bacterium Y1923]|uniref:threonine/serine ThrE exporter family protein n=1 Tax=Aestuariimicrobium sp. Y1814 TaxID=3418742 RepID=UPI003C1FCDB5